MKKLLITIIILAIIQSCKKDENSPENVNMIFYSYYHLTGGNDNYPYPKSYPSKDCKVVIADCFFYASEDIKTTIFKENLVIENYSDFPKTHSEVISLLEKDGKLKLSDGTFVMPITVDIRKYDNSQPLGFSFYPSNRVFTYIDILKDKNNYDELSRNVFALKPGKYFVVAVCRGYDFPYGYYYSEKYSGKFITVSTDMPIDDSYVKIVFPYDEKHKGYFEWIDATWN